AVASIALQNIIWAAVALFLFAHGKDKRRIDWPRDLFSISTLFFLLTFFLGAILGTDPAMSFQTVHKYLTLLLIFIFGAMSLGSEENEKLVHCLTYGAAFCSLHGIWEHFFHHQDRITSFSGDKMVFGGMLMVALLLQISFLIKNPKNPWMWAAFFLIGAALFLTQTRGAWIGFLVGFGMLAWRLNRKWLFAGILLCALSIFILPQQIKDRLWNMTHIWVTYDDQHQLHAANETRILIWIAGWEMIKDHPWGVGQGNVSVLFPKYNQSPVLAETEPTVPHLHNDLLQLLAQNGWIGLAAYLVWFVAFYWTASRYRSNERQLENFNWTLVCIFTSVLVWGLTEYTFSHQFMN